MKWAKDVNIYSVQFLWYNKIKKLLFRWNSLGPQIWESKDEPLDELLTHELAKLMSRLKIGQMPHAASPNNNKRMK